MRSGRPSENESPLPIAELFDRHWPIVWRAAYAITGQREMANDVAQDAFMQAMYALERFDRQRPFAPWITRIAVNRAIDLLRKEWRAVPLEVEAKAEEAGPEHDQEILHALQKLQPERRAVVVLHYWLGYNVSEIAAILNIPRGTVGSRLSRALGDLRRQLEAEHV